MGKATSESLAGIRDEHLAAVEQAPVTGRSVGRYQFRVADSRDDASIRQLFRETPMEGAIRVSLRCEPSYFQTVGGGLLHQTLVACEGDGGRVVGTGVRSVQRRYVDGQPQNVGYLSGLRILKSHRGGTLLARGYREMRRLHGDGLADFYLTTIVDGNQPAFSSLTGGRAALPAYFPLGRYHTCVLPTYGSRLGRRRDDLQIRPMLPDELSETIAFLNREGRRKLFFPCYCREDFAEPKATFRGLRGSDVLVARRDDELLGVLGVWDQRSMKQCVIEGYGPMLKWGRTAFNGVARCVGWPTFPAVGRTFPAVSVAFPVAKDDDVSILAGLLDAARVHARQRDQATRSLMIGAFEKDAWFDWMGRSSLYRFVSHVYLVYWDEAKVNPQRFAGRNLFMELGSL